MQTTKEPAYDIEKVSEKHCYKCYAVVPEDEQETAQALENVIMESGPEWHELYSDEFVHCTGPKEQFYEDGSPVVCVECVLRIGLETWKSRD